MAIFTRGRRKIEIFDVINNETKFIVDMLRDFPEFNVFVYTDDPYITDPDELSFMNSKDAIIYVQVTHPNHYNEIDTHAKKYFTSPFLHITWKPVRNSDNTIHFNYWAHAICDTIYLYDRYRYSALPKKHIFSCLNNVAKPHRISTVLHLMLSHNDSLYTLNN